MPMRLVRNHELRVLLIAGVGAGLAAVALCLTLVVRTNQAEQYRRQTATNCEAVEQLKSRIRETFLDGRDRASTNPALDVSQRNAVIGYYDRELKRYARVECPSP